MAPTRTLLCTAIALTVLVSGCATPIDAQHQALGLLDATVNRQSNALSFGDAYLLLGAIFLGSLPFLLLARKRKGAKPQVALADH